MNNLRALLGQLKSDKLKERQQGIASLREVFSRDAAVERLDETGDGLAWLVMFQALFTAVLNERSTAIKKTTKSNAANIRRLEEAASAVRWLVERSVTRLNRKVVKALLVHLLQTIVHQGQLLTPIGLDYVKAMRVLLSYTPHMEHLDADQWIKIMSVSFAVVLGDNLRIDIEDDVGTAEAEPADHHTETSEEEDGRMKKRRKLLNDGPASQARTVSLEQIEFTAVISLLLRSSNSPLLSSQHPLLADAILNRLCRFFAVFTSDTSAHLDAMGAVNSVINCLSLNAREKVTVFGIQIWDHLLSQWNTKNRQMKEGVIVALRTLFPYVTHTNAAFNKLDAVGRLFHLLHNEHDLRWGIEALSLDSLRLEVTSGESGAFEASTFRYGFNFSPSQALSWAALEMQADCVKELFLLSESNHSQSLPSTARPEGRKQKYENALITLVRSIQASHSASIRVAHLQSLLFIIDRHWHIFHSELRNEVISVLLHLISSDDPIAQSWVFLCFAALTYSHKSAETEGIELHTSVPWDLIWSHAMRRTNVPLVCRAACHTAHQLLISHKLPLHRILVEIEAMAQDLNVQGPSAPYDAVCSFFIECVKVATQDVRLYKLQLEEKILAWLTENWSAVEGSSKGSIIGGQSRSRIDQRTMQDLFSLLESICSLAERNTLQCEIALPICPIVDAIQFLKQTQVIRDFLLHARLPSYDRNRLRGDVGGVVSVLGTSESKDKELLQPSGRERKTSAFLLKILEHTVSFWEVREEGFRPQTEVLRQSLDLAVLGISFESALVVNNIRLNRRVLSVACKLLQLLIPLLSSMKWSSEEIHFILLGLAPLTADIDKSFHNQWTPLLEPGEYTGIRRNVMNPATLHQSASESCPHGRRERLQKTIWQSSDVQDVFAAAATTLRCILSTLAVAPAKLRQSSTEAMVIDGEADFAPIMTARSTPGLTIDSIAYGPENAAQVQLLSSTVMQMLALAPLLQASDDQPLREKFLADLVCKCDDERFAALGHPYLHHVQRAHVYLSSHTLNKLLDRFETLLMAYAFSRSEAIQILAIHLLMASAPVWLERQTYNSEVSVKVRQLIQWFSGMLQQGKIRPWRIRDHLVRFYDFYLRQDPGQTFITSTSSEEDEMDVDTLPDCLLPTGSSDEDIRIRFSVATACAHLLSSTYISGKDAFEVYDRMKEHLSVSTKHYEGMLTRLLFLGNVMIASSATRRGCYWHLLEICFHDDSYIPHLDSILNNVADRMGLEHHSELFEAYASQLAYTIGKAGKDVFKFPPQLVGYKDRKEFARSTFLAFSPTNLLIGTENQSTVEDGKERFDLHCRMVDKSEEQGLTYCFAAIVAFQVTFRLDDFTDSLSEDDDIKLPIDQQKAMTDLLYQLFEPLGPPSVFQDQLGRSADRVVVAILKTLGETDYRPGGQIMKQLGKIDVSGTMTDTFAMLMKYRGTSDFEMHTPNLPSFRPITVLLSLDWLTSQVAQAIPAATTYHVLHQFFGEITSSPLINEQLRLMHALALWIAMHHQHFKAGALLRTLSHGASVLLAQPDLYNMALGILDWTLSYYLDTHFDDPHLSDILIRICFVAQNYVQQGHIAARFKEVGQHLLEWTERQMTRLSRSSRIRRKLGNALAAWPGELNADLAIIRDGLSNESLSGILGDHRLTSHKFKLVRRLADLSAGSKETKIRFAKLDFWRIKDSIPDEEIPDDELHSFAMLMLANSGHIESNATDLTSQRTIAAHHIRITRGVEEKAKKIGTNSAKQPFFAAILDMLSNYHSDTVFVAYMALRRLTGVQKLEPMDSATWPSEYHTDMTYLNEYTLSQEPISAIQIQDIRSIPSTLCALFDSWISAVTIHLGNVLGLQDPFYGCLVPILESNKPFAEQALPVLVHAILQLDQLNRTKTDSRAILSEYFTRVLQEPTTDPRCLRTILDTILHLRNFQPDKRPEALAYNSWLEVDFMLLSRSAITCGAYTTALLFLELARESIETYDDQDSRIEEILFAIYQHIDEPDGFYGIRTSDLQDFLLKRFHHEQQWDKAFNFHGASFESGNLDTGGAAGILQSLHSFGFDQLAMSTFTSMTTNGSLMSPETMGLRYELGWRTEVWDLPEVQLEDGRGQDMTLYSALRAIHRGRDSSTIDAAVRIALLSEIHGLRLLGNEDLVAIRCVNRNIMSLAQTQQWRREILDFISPKGDDSQLKASYEQLCNFSDDLDFEDLEKVMATRLSILRSLREREQREQIGMMLSPAARTLQELEKCCLVQLSAAARAADRPQIALNSITRARRLDGSFSASISEEYANVLWRQREQKLAIQMLKSCIQSDPSSNEGSMDISTRARKAFVLCRLGEWINEACLEKPDAIQKTYFSTAISLFPATGSGNIDEKIGDISTVHYKFALFAEQQYHAISNSPDLIRLKVYTARKKQEMKEREESLRRTQPSSEKYHLMKHHRDKARALYEQDTLQFSGTTQAKDAFLCQAVQMLSICLEQTDAHNDDAAIRLCSLWFANFPYSVLNTVLEDALKRVPSHKFIFLAHQLTARLSSSEANSASKSQSNLQNLVFRMCREHPFHSLYQLYSLRPSNPSTGNRRHSSRIETQSSSQTERAAAAVDIFKQLESLDDICSRRARDIQLLCDAYLEWAKYPIKGEMDLRLRDKARAAKPLFIPSSSAIRKIKDMKVAVTTAHTPIDLTLSYDNCVWIKGYRTEFKAAGGVNHPKITFCEGSDGAEYKQLFKGEGKDDLRQDAVMEQVFEVCNWVLRKDRETRRRELHIRSYTVVPLAPQAGMMEFVTNTSPLNGWLEGAHARYRPRDLISKQLKHRMGLVRANGGGEKELVADFKDIRSKFKPVMRHFFTERHKVPLRWFEMRLRYSRSVATTSIIGYILGLGDRHTSNILIDNHTGEVVHIDLGIAFDQGKLLNVPEKVPFRLTADIVDGFGISGTEGVFRRCAEQTLRVLRDGSDVIRTVLEVFKYDPLHSWTASVIKIRKAQGVNDVNQDEALENLENLENERLGIGIDMESGTDEEAADRALSGVFRKLDKSLSVEYTVNDLISEATDITNLATIFPGWGPWL